MSTSNPASPGKPWVRFSLRTLLVAMLVLGLVAAWFGRELDRARRQEDVIQKLKAAGVGVGYDFKRSESLRFQVPRLPPSNSLLRTVLREDKYAHADRAIWRHKPGIQVDQTLALLPELPRLTQLNLNNIPVTEQSLALIARNQQLADLELDLRRTPGVTAQGLAQLANARQLAQLTLRGPEVTDETVQGLADVSQLKSVSLVLTSVTSAGLSPLRKLHHLRVFEIYLSPAVDDQIFTHLQPHAHQLEMLTILQCSVTDAGLVHLRDMPRLRWLGLDNMPIGDAGLAHLAGLSELEELRMPGSKVTDAGLQHIARLPKLKCLHLAGANITKQGLQELAQLPKLETLLLWDIPLADADIEVLQAFPSLKEVCLGPKIKKAAAQKLQQQMPRCSFRGDDPNGVNTFSLPALQK